MGGTIAVHSGISTDHRLVDRSYRVSAYRGDSTPSLPICGSDGDHGRPLIPHCQLLGYTAGDLPSIYPSSPPTSAIDRPAKTVPRHLRSIDLEDVPLFLHPSSLAQWDTRGFPHCNSHPSANGSASAMDVGVISCVHRLGRSVEGSSRNRTGTGVFKLYRHGDSHLLCLQARTLGRSGACFVPLTAAHYHRMCDTIRLGFTFPRCERELEVRYERVGQVHEHRRCFRSANPLHVSTSVCPRIKADMQTVCPSL